MLQLRARASRCVRVPVRRPLEGYTLQRKPCAACVDGDRTIDRERPPELRGRRRLTGSAANSARAHLGRRQRDGVSSHGVGGLVRRAFGLFVRRGSAKRREVEIGERRRSRWLLQQDSARTRPTVEVAHRKHDAAVRESFARQLPSDSAQALCDVFRVRRLHAVRAVGRMEHVDRDEGQWRLLPPTRRVALEGNCGEAARARAGLCRVLDGDVVERPEGF